jgi:hypothetical protein
MGSSDRPESAHRNHRLLGPWDASYAPGLAEDPYFRTTDRFSLDGHSRKDQAPTHIPGDVGRSRSPRIAPLPSGLLPRRKAAGALPDVGEDAFRATDRRRGIESGHRMTSILAIRRRPISSDPERRCAIRLDPKR